jgi:hypothetical protein
MALYSPPAGIDDFERRPSKPSMARGWDAVINAWFSEVALTYSCDGGGSLFFDPRKVEAGGDPRIRQITWDAFPRAIANWFRGAPDADRQRWRSADSLRGRANLRYVDENGEPVGAADVFYRQQDEYCEWFVEREAGRPRRINFTCEPPEYWQFLAHGTKPFFPREDSRSELFAGDMTLVEELYREHIDDSVRAEELLWPHDVQRLVASDPVTGQQVWVPYARKGTYNPLNPWNTLHGAMHLTHPSNSLNAEMHLAGGASVPRIGIDGTAITNAHQLVCATGYGNPNRASDPQIGKAVNDLTGRGLSVSLAEPVGLYIADMDESRFRGPEQADVTGAWRVMRGDRDSRRILRAVYEPQTGRPVADLQIDGQNIQYGGQVADAVQLELTAIARPLGVSVRARTPIVGGCCRHPQRPAIFAIPPDGKTCADINWDRLAPIVTPSADSEGRDIEIKDTLYAVVDAGGGR